MPIHVKIETITPKIADEMLERNHKNRYLSDDRAKLYAEAMTEGEWQENGETVKFTEDGELIDGQHRLKAVVLSKTQQRMLVVRGLKYEHIQTIDIGRKRSNADMLEINGYKNKLNLAAAVGICLDFYSGQYIQKKKQKSPTRILKYIKANPRIALIVNNTVKYAHNTKLRSMISTSLLAALYHQFSMVSKTKADLFWDDFINAQKLNATSPPRVLREKLSAMARNIHRARGEGWRREIISYATQAFNAYVNGKSLTQLKYDPAQPIHIKRH